MTTETDLGRLGWTGLGWSRWWLPVLEHMGASCTDVVVGIDGGTVTVSFPDGVSPRRDSRQGERLPSGVGVVEDHADAGEIADEALVDAGQVGMVLGSTRTPSSSAPRRRPCGPWRATTTATCTSTSRSWTPADDSCGTGPSRSACRLHVAGCRSPTDAASSRSNRRSTADRTGSSGVTPGTGPRQPGSGLVHARYRTR